MIPDGYTDLAPGKIASVVTYLEMRSRPALENVHSGRVRLRRVENPEVEWYRAIYLRAGGQWLWFSRLEMGEKQLSSLLKSATTELFLAESEAGEIGIAELDRSTHPHVEVTTFALFADAIGKGLARNFMAKLLERAWETGAARVWLHTCTLDHSAALSFYMKCGFHAYKRAIEVADDPRLRGLLPVDAAPQVPIIR